MNFTENLEPSNQGKSPIRISRFGNKPKSIIKKPKGAKYKIHVVLNHKNFNI